VYPDQGNFNRDQGQISYQRVVAKPRSAVPSGVLFLRPMPWFKRFYDPIILPDGRKLLGAMCGH
jgi:hypothetical protein